MTLETLVKQMAIGLAIGFLTWATTYQKQVQPAQQEQARAEKWWGFWKEKNGEKKLTIAELEAQLDARRHECDILRENP